MSTVSRLLKVGFELVARGCALIAREQIRKRDEAAVTEALRKLTEKKPGSIVAATNESAAKNSGNSKA